LRHFSGACHSDGGQNGQRLTRARLRGSPAIVFAIVAQYEMMAASPSPAPPTMAVRPPLPRPPVCDGHVGVFATQLAFRRPGRSSPTYQSAMVSPSRHRAGLVSDPAELLSYRPTRQMADEVLTPPSEFFARATRNCFEKLAAGRRRYPPLPTRHRPEARRVNGVRTVASAAAGCDADVKAAQDQSYAADQSRQGERPSNAARLISQSRRASQLDLAEARSRRSIACFSSRAEFSSRCQATAPADWPT